MYLFIFETKTYVAQGGLKNHYVTKDDLERLFFRMR